MAIGDFDGDANGDLAVGVLENFAAFNSLIFGGWDGAVHVFYASRADQFWHQGSDGVKGTREAMELFGAALAAGHFDDDGFEDLAICVPMDDVWQDETVTTNCGSVTILYGSSSGLTSRDQRWHQGRSGVSGFNVEFDEFGAVLAKLL